MGGVGLSLELLELAVQEFFGGLYQPFFLCCKKLLDFRLPELFFFFALAPPPSPLHHFSYGTSLSTLGNGSFDVAARKLCQRQSSLLFIGLVFPSFKRRTLKTHISIRWPAC